AVARDRIALPRVEVDLRQRNGTHLRLHRGRGHTQGVLRLGSSAMRQNLFPEAESAQSGIGPLASRLESWRRTGGARARSHGHQERGQALDPEAGVMAYALLIDESQLPAVGEFDIDDAPSGFGRVQGVDPRFAFGELSWLRAWAAAYTQEGDWRGPVRAYAAHDGVRCLGMVALASQRLKGIRIKSLAGYYWPFRTLCASAEPGERNRFAEEMAMRFARRPPASVLRFGPISSNDEGINVLLSGMRSHGWLSLYKKVGDVFVLDVPKTPESIEERVSASLHKNIQYLRRRLRKQGARLDFERHALPEAGRDVLH